MLCVGSIDQFWAPRRRAAAWPKRISYPEERLEAEPEEAKGASGVGDGARLSLIPRARVGTSDRIPAARRAREGNASTLASEAGHRAKSATADGQRGWTKPKSIKGSRPPTRVRRTSLYFPDNTTTFIAPRLHPGCDAPSAGT